jgi:hypothetical protein
MPVIGLTVALAVAPSETPVSAQLLAASGVVLVPFGS